MEVGAGPAKRGEGAAFFAFLPGSGAGAGFDQGICRQFLAYPKKLSSVRGWGRGLTKGFADKAPPGAPSPQTVPHGG